MIIDNELGRETLANRIPDVAAAMGIKPKEYRDRIDVLSLRGRLKDLHGTGRILRQYRAGEYAAVIVDSYYWALPQGTAENDNAQIAAVYNLIASFAERLDAAVFLIHHSTKGNQSKKSTTDVGAGAGSQSRAADTHLILRPHEDDRCVVLDVAVRSFPPVEPIVFEWIFPLWTPRDDLDSEELKGRQTTKQGIFGSTSKVVDGPRGLRDGPASIEWQRVTCRAFGWWFRFAGSWLADCKRSVFRAR